MPIVNDKRISYIDIFDKFCNGNSKCIENIYSPKIFEDMHHLKKNFVCQSKLIFKIIDDTLGLYLDNANNKTILCYKINICVNSKYNSFLLQQYNISIITNVKFYRFGFAAKPIFNL